MLEIWFVLAEKIQAKVYVYQVAISIRYTDID
jgi:hypothetical protein